MFQNFNYLINLVYNTINANKVISDVKKVEDSIKWDTKQHEAKLKSFAQQGIGAIGEQAAVLNPKIAKSKGFVDEFTNAAKRALVVAPVWMAIRTAMQGVLNLISENAKFLVDLETAMARIQIVGKGNREEYKRLQDTLISMSIAYGVSASKAIEAAKIFAQQGKSVNETIILTQQAMLASQLLGEDVTQTVESLTAALNGFNIPAFNAASVIDRLIAVEKEFAVTSGDLSAAIKRTGATANQLGISISEFLGDVTSVIEVTRKSGSEAANGLAFIYARLLTTGRPVVEQIANTSFYLDEQGKATDSLTGKLRPVSDILGDLAQKWGALETAEKLEIASAVAYKRQMTTFNALMQNYNQSLKARVIALTAAGTAEKAFGILQETTAFKMQQLTSTWNNLATAISDTTPFKVIIDFTKAWATNITALASYEKALRAASAEAVKQQELQIQTQFTLAENYKELVKVRDRLLKSPSTAGTIDQINILNDAIDNIIEKNPTLEIAVKTGNTQQIDQALTTIQQEALKKQVVLRVVTEFSPKIADVQRAINSGLGGIFQRRQLQEKLVNLEKEQTKQIEIQYEDLLAGYTAQKANQDLLKDEDELQSEITEKEKEQLAIEVELTKQRIEYGKTSEELIQKEIELTNNSKYIFTEQEKQIKLQRLQNQLIETRLQLQEEERQKYEDLYLEFSKGTDEQKAQIRKLFDLIRLGAGDLAGAFRGDEANQQLILQNWDKFTEEGKSAVLDIIKFQNNLPEPLPEFQDYLSSDLFNKNANFISPTPVLDRKTIQEEVQKDPFASPLLPFLQEMQQDITVSVYLDGKKVEGTVEKIMVDKSKDKYSQFRKQSDQNIEEF